MPEIEKLRNGLSRTIDKKDAIKKAKALSRERKKPYSVVKSFSEFLNSQCYYIEDGFSIIRTSEELVGVYEDGKQL